MKYLGRAHTQKLHVVCPKFTFNWVFCLLNLAAGLEPRVC